MNDATNQNQDSQRLRQVLEEATAADASVARRAPSNGHCPLQPQDPEVASLREAWLAFEQLIRAADASAAAMPNVATSIAPPKPRRRRWLGVVAAVTATLLVALPLEWWMAAGKKVATPAPIAKQDKPRSVVAGTASATNGQKSVTTNLATWEDPLETQIALVSQQISNVEQSWRHRVDDVDLVQYRIDEVADSLQNDAL